MGEPRSSRRGLALVAVVVVVAGWAASRGGHGSGSAGPAKSAAPTVSSAPESSPTGRPSPTAADQDPARFAPQVARYAEKADVDPQLLMAILYNESYKPHDPAWERAWQRIKPDAAFGVANMHKAAFDQVKQGRDFAGRDWQQLPDDPALAIEAAAWYLHDLARQLPAQRSSPYPKDELLALGYNTGPGNMDAFAQGAKPGSAAQSYLDRLHANWSTAAQALHHSR
ncbi:transglycosylase SLT domain-containing protein [Streptantibioticus ferralitis]|uniref:Transglycosylase SLT domain-containing protein n=1 Tax=Streptantibioticus ferralitis TaxID=236510 RepID=A0ABT5Z3W2_9ACTN|nr:transglycosylase SLT domain-containing protein [Streptantibioticus ferralitis]MDF2258515.1 transglycosylase SLT domain-containing protein [Streptantibioticus ferralitis]